MLQVNVRTVAGMNAISEPKLAPPGAGLPLVELLIARLRFAWARMRGARTQFTAQFERERDTILKLVRALSPELAGRRILIPRSRGMEDSSRNWSVWMTLDHLRITNTAFGRVIHLLAQGHLPQRAASTAAVKPSPEVDASVVEGFERSCEFLLHTAAGVPDLQTKSRYAHPWFGPLDAAGWHALCAGHMSLHRGQIERIIDGLGR
jgi:hypothetical protein